MGRTARGEQKVNLHKYCWYKGIVIHEIAHAIGFFHEQSRTDRDSYVKIIYTNIEVGKMPGALHVQSKSKLLKVVVDGTTLLHGTSWIALPRSRKNRLTFII